MKKSWKKYYIFEEKYEHFVEQKLKIMNNRSIKHQDQSFFIQKIHSYQGSGDIFFSLELSPSKNQDDLITRFLKFINSSFVHPLFLSVTNLTNINDTLSMSSYLKNHFDFFVLFHLVGGQVENDIHLQEILNKASSLKLNNFLALRGDKPLKISKYKYAIDVMQSAKTMNLSYKWNIAIAGYPNGHPESINLEQDIDYLHMKTKEGGDLIITQLFYEPKILINFVRKCRLKNINIPILAGFMPLQSYKNALKICSITGVNIPEILKNNLKSNMHRPEATKRFIIDYAIDCLKEVLTNRGVVGIHFFTLNRFDYIPDILTGLDLGKARIEYPFLLLK